MKLRVINLAQYDKKQEEEVLELWLEEDDNGFVRLKSTKTRNSGVFTELVIYPGGAAEVIGCGNLNIKDK